jgi:hypothetical protein
MPDVGFGASVPPIGTRSFLLPSLLGNVRLILSWIFDAIDFELGQAGRTLVAF